MRIHEISESLNTILDWDWDKDTVATFDSPDGTPYWVVFLEEGEGVYQFAFDVRGDANGEMTGEGRSLTILSTVIDIAKDFVNRNPVESLRFGAKTSEPSRLRAYRAMTRRLGATLNFEYTESSENFMGIDVIMFTIHR